MINSFRTKTIQFRPNMRWLGFALIAWLVLEFFLFWLCVERLGLFPTLVFLMLKGGLGFLLLAFKLRDVLKGFTASHLTRGGSHFASGMFVAIGAFLILIPGFVSTFAGLALFSPSLRALAMRRLRKQKQRGGARDKEILLDPDEWREVSRRKTPTRKPKSPTIAP